MLKQDVPLRTGWFGYRKLDVENCIAHIRAAYAAELRLARQTQQGMEETMAQLRQENKALRQRFAQQAAAQAAASVRAEGSDKLQQLTRKLEAAHAEIRRYQTRLFACERQMIALRRENADLEAACEQAREELTINSAPLDDTATYTVFVAGTDVWIENEVYCNCPMPENLKAKRTEYAIEGAESRSCLKDSLAVSKQFPAPSEYLTIVQGE